ncbi:MAG: hypothetical protein ABIG20_03210 [archaeon]
MIAMKNSHFELTFIPNNNSAMELLEVSLNANNLKKVKEGTGKKDSIFEGFDFKRYEGKGFSIHLLSSKTRNGIMFKSASEKAKETGLEVYTELVNSIRAEIGAVPWNEMVRIGPSNVASGFKTMGGKAAQQLPGGWATDSF